MSLYTFRDIRTAKGMSVDYVAVYIGIDSNQLIEYENNAGSIPCSVALRLCGLYGVVSFDDILF